MTLHRTRRIEAAKMKALTLLVGSSDTMANSNKRSGAGTGTNGTRRATIEDVADGAGVSVATVSRALRNLPNVADSTRQRVVDIARDLAYRPDPAAARLAAGRTGTVTIAVPGLGNWYFSNVVAGAEAVCADAGLEFQVIGIADLADRDRLLDEDRRLEQRTDALILVDIATTDAQAASLDRRNIAFATIGTRVTGHPSVRIDDVLVGNLAAHHLIGLGHDRLALIGGLRNDPLSFEVPRARERGYRIAIESNGLALDDSNIASGNFGISGGYEAMVTLLDQKTPPTGVFAMSDEMAFGALMAFNERGIRAGVDISIIGVDDHEFSQVVDLTTIRQNVADHGAKAARMLVTAMASTAHSPRPTDAATVHSSEGHSTSAVHEIDELEPTIELIARSSTGHPTR
jgi:LacI family transcriptional regulator, repressor for deo operon, udp, cdd, tsx, nupC, and nupG